MQIKLPSLSFLIQSAVQSLKKFPLVIISAINAACIAIYLINHTDSNPNHPIAIAGMLCCLLGISLFFSISVWCDKKNISSKNKFFLNALGVLILLCIFLTMPLQDTTHIISVPYYRFGIYAITMHLIASFLPFLTSSEINGFWQFNKTLFLRLFFSVIFSAFVYLGLALALVSVDALFEVKINFKIYGELFVTVAFVFNTWFFISGMPNDLNTLETLHDYPAGLRIFAQYILLPLLSLYLLILYAYGSKIVYLWNWPKGIVSYLIAGISVIGTLTFLLLFPYAMQKEFSWISKITKGFYRALIPLLALLFMAILMRIDDYGITENRYMILTMGIWLSIVCLYFVFRNNIKFIPASLAVLLLIISFGPWGIFSVSEKQQVNRLKKILEHSGILKNNKIQNENMVIKGRAKNDMQFPEGKNMGLLNDSLKNEVRSILNYLDDNHGFKSIQSWFTQNMDALISIQSSNKNTQTDESDIYLTALGLHQSDHTKEINTLPASIKIITEGFDENLIRVAGYDWAYQFNCTRPENTIKPITHFNIEGTTFKVYVESLNTANLIIDDGNEKIVLPTGILFDSCLKLNTSCSLPSEFMSVEKQSQQWILKLQFHQIEFEKNKGSSMPKHIDAVLLLRKKQSK